MRVLVVHESLFGNTRAVAAAIAAGVEAGRPDADVGCIPAARLLGSPPIPLDDVDLLVVGCPTHAWGMSSLRSRTAQIAKDRDQAPDRRHDPEAEAPGVRELLDVLSTSAPGVRAAAFDTRLGSRFSGGAAPRLARALRRSGAVVVGRPTGFIVTGMTGPLRDGELERARAWGGELTGNLAPAAQAPTA